MSQAEIFKKVNSMIPSGSMPVAISLWREGRISEDEFVIWLNIRETMH